MALQNFINKQTRISGDNVPVGFAVEDTEVLLLNKDGRPAEVSGEIAVKSAHVALGYWRNPGATARAFTTNGGGPAIRIYRTGDMGRRLPDGSLLFEGRKDFQVKIRGFRVELGEIESAINQHHAIREGVVVMKEDAAGDQRLIAYVVPRETRPTPDELRGFLKPKLPDYMIPSSFVVLDSLPLTSSGKLNRRALPAPDESADRAATTLAAPRTPMEKSLTKIWANVLETSAIGINDNFFDLGGHSLLAVRLFAQIEKKLGKRLPLATLFQAPTVAQLAGILKEENAPSWSSLVSIQTLGSRLPFFAFTQSAEMCSSVTISRDISVPTSRSMDCSRKVWMANTRRTTASKTWRRTTSERCARLSPLGRILSADDRLGESSRTKSLANCAPRARRLDCWRCSIHIRWVTRSSCRKLTLSATGQDAF